MEDNELPQRLSRIQTRWSVVFQAHHASGQALTAAQQALLERYSGAIYRYLLAAVRDSHHAEELCQEFALQLLQGHFRRVDPQRGRFRDYVKTVLFHLVASWGRKQNKQPRGLGGLGSDSFEPADTASPTEQSDQAFLNGWREELLAKTWETLQRLEQQTGQLYYTMLRFRAEHTEVKSEAMAKQLSERLDKPLTAAAVRQTIHRAREKFAELLLDEVARSLETTDAAQLEHELIDLELLPYCQEALKKRLS